MVLGKRRRVFLGAELVQKLRRALDVGEEEGDGSGGKVTPHLKEMMRPRGPGV